MKTPYFFTSNQRLRFTVIFAAVTAVLVATGLAQPTTQPTTARALPFRIAPDTTVITEPLLPDGLPDYIGAINASLSHGITPANNAAVPLLQAMDPERALSPPVAARTYQLLGIECPLADGTFFKDFPEIREEGGPHETALRSPWKAADHPELVQWLKENQAPLARFVEASQRSRYYVPLLSPSEGGSLNSALLPSLGQYRAMTKAIIIRANLAISEGRVDDAWADILACHRLSVLLDQDSTLIGRLVGIAIGALADESTASLAASGKLTAEKARGIIGELRSLPPRPTTITALEFERYCMLDTICRIALDRRHALIMFQRGDSFLANLSSIIVTSGVDFSEVLKQTNRRWDQLIAGAASPTYAQFQARTQQFDAMLQRLVEARILAVPIGNQPAPAAGRPSAKTVWFADVLLSALMPSLSRAETLARRQLVLRDMAMVTVALNGYYTEKGAYPDTLDALVPAWLEKVPVDSISGKPLAHKLSERSYVLYIFGNNDRDDGGKNEKDGGDDIAYAASR